MQNATPEPIRAAIGVLRKVSQSEKERRLRDRRQWLRQVDLLDAFDTLFDHMPEYRVFLKRRPGEIMFVSRAMVHTLRADDEFSLIGVCDHEVTPGPLADLYRSRDEEVLRSGRSITGLEVWFTREGLPQWFVCHKLPLKNRAGRVVGIIGFLKEYEHIKQLPVSEPLGKAIACIKRNISSPLRVRDIARATHLSARQLERLFRSVFGISPKEFIIKTRVHTAVELLMQSEASLVQIALDTGFCDQSALTYYFRRELGITPQRFRKAAMIWANYKASEPTSDTPLENPSGGAKATTR